MPESFAIKFVAKLNRPGLDAVRQFMSVGDWNFVDTRLEIRKYEPSQLSTFRFPLSWSGIRFIPLMPDWSKHQSITGNLWSVCGATTIQHHAMQFLERTLPELIDEPCFVEVYTSTGRAEVKRVEPAHGGESWVRL